MYVCCGSRENVISHTEPDRYVWVSIVCDRVNDRIQVFRKDGSFVKEVFGHDRVDLRRGTARVGRHVCAKLLGEAEVHHLDTALGREHHIGRLQITVNDALRVRGVERLGDFTRDAEPSVLDILPSARVSCSV